VAKLQNFESGSTSVTAHHVSLFDLVYGERVSTSKLKFNRHSSGDAIFEQNTENMEGTRDDGESCAHSVVKLSGKHLDAYLAVCELASPIYANAKRTLRRAASIYFALRKSSGILC